MMFNKLLKEAKMIDKNLIKMDQIKQSIIK